MEYHIIHKQFFIAFTGLSCGILSILFGGFGNILWDKILHLIVFIAVSFINFYLIMYDKKQNLTRIIVLTVFIIIYSVLINLLLIFWSALILVIFLLFPKNKSISIPDLWTDSPLIFGIKNVPAWKIFILLLYSIPLFLL